MGITEATGGFIVVDMQCGLIEIYPPPATISCVACGVDGFDGYGFGAGVVGVVGDDGVICWSCMERIGMMGCLLKLVRIFL